jgi:hypothetical protein
MNYQEIIEICEKAGITKSEYGYGEFPKELGEVKEVFRQGGEGKGENWERVYHFVEHDVYLSMSAYYQSYNGCDFEDYEPTQVFPKEKVITVYE